MDAFFRGAIAGYGIAIPVGAIAILIVEMAIRRGFWLAFLAGAGAATVDLLFAGLAASAGQALAALLAPLADGLRLASGLILIALGVWGLWQLRRKTFPSAAPAVERKSGWLVYGQFIGLTLLNPMTVAYFTILILGNGSDVRGWMARLYFVAGAGLASLSWQTLLAGLGTLARQRLTGKFQTGAILVGNLIIMGLGVQMMV